MDEIDLVILKKLMENSRVTYIYIIINKNKFLKEVNKT